MHFTHYQITGGKVFAVSPIDMFSKGFCEEDIPNREYDEFQDWLSTQPEITADPSIKDGVYAKELLEIVWQWKPKEDYPFDGSNDPLLYIKDWQDENKDDWHRKDISYTSYVDFEECIEWGFYTRQIATLKQTVKQEEKPFPETVKEVEEYEAKIGNPDVNFPVEEMLIDFRLRMYKAKSENAISELLSCLKELWPLATNAFGELTIEQVKDDAILNRLNLSIDLAKQLIDKYKNPLTP